MRIRPKFFLLLLLCSCSAFAHQWLVRSSNDYFQDHHAGLSVVFEFNNQDKLFLLDSQAVKQALLSDQVRYAKPNLTLDEDPLSPYSITNSESYQNGFSLSGFESLTSFERECDLVPIAVLDSGVDTEHPSLSSVQVSAPYNAIDDTHYPNDQFGHGTHVTGIIASSAFDGSLGQGEGGCSSSTIMPIRFLNRSGGGSLSDAIAGIQWAIDNDARIINHSWTVSRFSTPLFDVMYEADQAGIIQITAAGNSGKDLDDFNAYPAKFAPSLRYLIAVANWDAISDKLATSSNYQWSFVDIAAPGTDILSLAPDGQFRIDSGSSMAAPWVSAAVASYLQANSQANAGQALAALLQTSIKSDSLVGGVNQGQRLDVSSLSNHIPKPHPLNITTIDNEMFLFTTDIDQVTQLDFESSTKVSADHRTDIHYAIVGENELGFDAWGTPAGWWVVHDTYGSQTRLPYLPTLSAPTDVSVIRTEQGNLVTWRGVTYSTEFQLYRQDQYTSNALIANIDAPTNQYLDTQGESDAIYQVRQSYLSYIGDEVLTYQSDKSSASVDQDDMWTTQSLARVPLGRTARFPIQVDAERLELLNDENNLVNAITGTTLEINTQIASSASIQLQDPVTMSSHWFDIAIQDQPYWQWLNDNDAFELIESDIQLTSVQQLDGSRLMLTGELQSNFGIIQFSPVSELNQRLILNLLDAPIDVSVSVLSSGVAPRITVESTDPAHFTITLNYATQSHASSASQDSRCFLASSVYVDQPSKLNFYRDFRDEVILGLPFGELMVKQYYKHSPVWVSFIDSHPNLKRFVVRMLDGFYQLWQ
ncbi:hypothetical protein ST37_04825 [Vibrio sp. qd031]|uniref:S8 family serine peptidase n=1 Tax=Vibrio sp. qd031 TaxID=1603038 RepID=UPI000A24646D|nr:S8 family serine peptidase [Vibrio sp. qd031]ORT51677.1 hypothetical protein ST37_04825 [Vibrio sp. qd031]